MNGWLPVHLLPGSPQLLQWMRFDAQPFREPFFEDTIQRVRLLYPENRSRFRAVTPLHLDNTGVAPDLLVYHVSRCGSTLLTQLLGEDERICTLSEVPLFDELLVTSMPDVQRQSVMNGVAALLRRGATYQLIKCDSWHILHAHRLRFIFPETPVVFLYRHPHEVWRSHKKSPGMHAVQGMLSRDQLCGFDAGAFDHPDPYFAALLALFYKHMYELAEHDEKITLLCYAEGPLAFTLRAAAAAGITISSSVKDAMIKRSSFHSKRPDDAFAGDGKNNVPEHLLSEATQWYEKLETLRAARQR